MNNKTEDRVDTESTSCEEAESDEISSTTDQPVIISMEISYKPRFQSSGVALDRLSSLYQTLTNNHK